ncbi:MAG: putative metal-binding motif-containing protein [Myxococcaceae bacterium]|nr:putative metal-binding motif-containing protein [Myxococcaceae bacterium]
MFWYEDADGDGFGSNARSSTGCQAPPGFVASNTDCDDSSPGVNPGSVELCDSANTDEDCDGLRNEGCQCSGIGSTRSCCSGRGVQTCQGDDAGASFSSCTASVSAEICNGVDDDCNELIDDLPVSDGGVSVDGGQVGLSCSVGVGACRRSSFEVCQAGSLVCPTDAGIPSSETCNGIDDDCNGMTDEASNLCSSIAGQACVAGQCACPAGQSTCGSACRTLGGNCSVGVGACRRTGNDVCQAGAVTCSSTAGMPTTETCNGIDDDCNGMTDDGANLCGSIAGQACIAGACACPSGQSVCGAACRTIGGSCAVGVGACRRMGADVCRSGAVTCDATAGTPGVESCNGIDDDCDGLTDEAGPGLCPASGQSCSGAACECPSGQVVCGSACVGLGGSCTVGTGGCARTGADTCSNGAITCSAVAGTPGEERCNGVDDDCDGLIDEVGFGLCPVTGQICGGGSCTCPSGQVACDGVCTALVTCVSDRDNDLYAGGTVTTQYCPNPARAAAGFCPVTFVGLAASLGSDCNDADPARYRIANIAVDIDADLYCGGPAESRCIGATLPANTRFATECRSNNDCNDLDPARYQIMTLRTDADGDGYCINPSAQSCQGASPPSGLRLATTCLGDDCRDTNFFANTTCSIPWGTTSATKSCGIGPPPSETFMVSVNQPSIAGCPIGFRLTSFTARQTSGSITGFCIAANLSGTAIRMDCPGPSFGSFTCRTTGECTPD